MPVVKKATKKTEKKTPKVPKEKKVRAERKTLPKVEWTPPTVHKITPKVKESFDEDYRTKSAKHLGYSNEQASMMLSTLSPAQRKVAELIGEGWKSSEIGTELGISSKTVDVHRGTLMNRLGIKRTKDLTLMVYADKLN